MYMAQMGDRQAFDSRLQDLPAEIWRTIARIDECKGQWRAHSSLSPDILENLKQSVLITSTGASTRIEGSTLSDDAVAKLMRGISVQKLVDRDTQEVRGYYDLLQHVFTAWEHMTFSENTIKHFHKELLQHVQKDQRHRGAYKAQENRVEMLDADGKSLGIVFDPVAAYLTPKAMQELTDWTKEALKENLHHPLLIIGAFIVEFLHIHPFTDGNGRLSRILTNLLLLQAGYAYIPYVSHEKLVEDHKTEYYLALRQSQRGEGIVSWLSFFLTMLERQSEMAVALLTQERIETSLSPKQLHVYRCLQERGECTAGDIAHQTAIARPTVNQALRKLLHLQAISRIGEGSATRYRLV